MVWKILAWASGAASVACLALMAVFNPACVAHVRDVPWLIGFFVFLVATPILWARGQRGRSGP